jgi:hypothetical protein
VKSAALATRFFSHPPFVFSDLNLMIRGDPSDLSGFERWETIYKHPNKVWRYFDWRESTQKVTVRLPIPGLHLCNQRSLSMSRGWCAMGLLAAGMRTTSHSQEFAGWFPPSPLGSVLDADGGRGGKHSAAVVGNPASRTRCVETRCRFCNSTAKHKPIKRVVPVAPTAVQEILRDPGLSDKHPAALLWCDTCYYTVRPARVGAVL